MDTNTKAIADKLRDISRSMSELAALVDGNIPGDRDLVHASDRRYARVRREAEPRPKSSPRRPQPLRSMA